MKIPKEFIKKALAAAGTFAASTAPSLITEVANEKMKQKKAQIKQEQIYTDQKHNGTVKIGAMIFSLISVILSIIAIKQSKIIISLIGLLAIITYFVTLLYCLDIITEKKKNTYRVVFIIGNLLMAIVVALLFF